MVPPPVRIPEHGGEPTSRPPEAHRAACLDWATELPILLRDPEPSGLGTGLGSAAHLELAQDRGDVVTHGPLRQEETFGDLPIPKALTDQIQDLQLTGGEP